MEGERGEKFELVDIRVDEIAMGCCKGESRATRWNLAFARSHTYSTPSNLQ